MTKPLNILVIAPHAPPKNTAEAIQVRRILRELDKYARGRVVKITPKSSSSWEQQDDSLELELKNFDTQTLELPLHSLTNGIISSHWLSRFHIPDSAMWIQWKDKAVLRELKEKPDLIYSRSSPMSAALLAAKLKRALNIPWVMHVSDPWADSLYKTFHPRDAGYEAKCFREADLAALTTPGQAEYYQDKYPDCADRIFVSPNVMPERTPRPANRAADDKLHIVFAGRLYGGRSPRPLLEAIDILRATQPEILKKLHVDFYGNAQTEAAELLRRAPDVLHYHGHVPYAEANAAQYAADIVFAIEPDSQHPLIQATLLSKITDCMAQGQPLLAITPDGSETARICNEGYGWAVHPAKPKLLAARIAELVTNLPQLRAASPKPAIAAYEVEPVVQELLARMDSLVDKGSM